MATFRDFTEFNPLERFSETILATSNSAEEEYWSMLKMPYKVTNPQLDIPKRHGITDKQVKLAALKRYGGFIQQAEANWRAARHADFHSSPLLYYYCFMNLMKAELVLRNPDMSEKLKHGLGIKNTNLPARFENLEALTNDGIFKEYYKLVYGVNPPTKLKIKEIINYLQEMSFQLVQGNFGKYYAVSYKSRLVMDPTHAWTIFIFPKSVKIAQYKKEFKSFFDSYELAIPQQSLNSIYTDAFGEKFQDWDTVDIYQNKTPIDRSDRRKIIEMLQTANKVFDTYLSSNLYKSNETAILNLPSSIKFREELSIYVLMFILSSLIRYNPDYMERINSKRFGWFLESFVNTAPTRYLQFMVNRIYDLNIKINTI